MVQGLVGVATSLQHTPSGDVSEPVDPHAEGLAAGVGVDHDGPKHPVVGRLPGERVSQVHGAASLRCLLVSTVREIATALAARTHPETTPEWDPVGLQLGDPESVVSRIAVCHEVTEDVVTAIEEDPVDLLVTYHPLLFTPTNRLLAGRSAGARSYRLLRLGVSLLVTHTDFDAAPGGAADTLAEFFALTDVREFGGDPAEGLPAIGRYGGFQGTLATVDAMIADAFGPAGLRITGDREMTIETLAVVPGSGSSLVEAAAEVADVLVTGDVNHHRSVAAADLGLAVVDPGHTATERPGMTALVSMVAELSDAGVVDLTHIDPKTWS